MRVYLFMTSLRQYAGKLLEEYNMHKDADCKEDHNGIDYNFHDSARHAKFQTHHNLYVWRKHNISQLLDVGDGRSIVKIHYQIQIYKWD